MKYQNLTPIQILEQMKVYSYKVRMGEMTYEQGKAETAEMLEEYNARARQVAKKYGRKWYDLTWTKLVRMK